MNGYYYSISFPIFAVQMKRKAIYTVKHHIYSIVMLLSLAWLTISVAFTPINQNQKSNTAQTAQSNSNTEEETPNPYGNGTEEKTETGGNTLSEYLHDHHLLSHDFVFLVKGRKSHPPSLYSDFDPELILPPPKSILS